MYQPYMNSVLKNRSGITVFLPLKALKYFSQHRQRHYNDQSRSNTAHYQITPRVLSIVRSQLFPALSFHTAKKQPCHQGKEQTQIRRKLGPSGAVHIPDTVPE